MAKGWPKRSLVVALAVVVAGCVGAAASASRVGKAPSGYSRVLMAAGASSPPAAADPMADCLMAATLLRHETGPASPIDRARFEALQSYCRAGLAGAAGKTGKPAAPTF